MILADHQAGKEIRKNVKALKEVILKAAEPNGTASKDLESLMNIISVGKQ